MLNQNNYARWLVYYHDKLLTVEKTHPVVAAAFQNGLLGVKRTTTPLSRSPYDLSLEQTYNADAGKKLTGISHFTNNSDAKERWARSHGVRTEVTSFLFRKLGLNRNSDVSNDLRPHQIKTDSEHLEKFINEVNKNINPFDQDKLDNNLLYNIKTGKVASEEVTNFLINAERMGSQLKNDFIKECSESEIRFESTIKKNKVFNFANSNLKKKVRVHEKVIEVQMQRDLFGRMLGVSMIHETNIEELLTYPLTPVPLSLCHLDGSACTTAKSKLLSCFKKEFNDDIGNAEVSIIDGFYFLHLLAVKKNYGLLSKYFLTEVTKGNAAEVHIIFDQYVTRSIKNIERTRRGADFHHFRVPVIAESVPILSSEYAKELLIPKFKHALVKFFIKHWSTDEMKPYYEHKKVLVSYDQCYLFQKSDDGTKVVTSVLDKYSCPSHEEADTRIIYHVLNTEASTFTIKCSDTDVLVILLGNYHKIKDNRTVYIESFAKKNSKKINVTSLYKELSSEAGCTKLCEALPGFYAITGCDYIPSFYNKGKTRPFKKLEKSEDHQNTFAAMSTCKPTELTPIYEKVQSFICDIYGFSQKKKKQNWQS